MQSLVKDTTQESKTALAANHESNVESISFIQEIPESLREAMTAFIEKHPNWDQYRLIQAAISGYLLQKGVESREINRLYSKSMFCKKAFGKSL